jgi:hypothetical protein
MVMINRMDLSRFPMDIRVHLRPSGCYSVGRPALKIDPFFYLFRYKLTSALYHLWLMVSEVAYVDRV